MKIAQIGQRSKKLGHGVKIIGRRIIKLVRIFKKKFISVHDINQLRDCIFTLFTNKISRQIQLIIAYLVLFELNLNNIIKI